MRCCLGLKWKPEDGNSKLESYRPTLVVDANHAGWIPAGGWTARVSNFDFPVSKMRSDGLGKSGPEGDRKRASTLTRLTPASRLARRCWLRTAGAQQFATWRTRPT